MDLKLMLRLDALDKATKPLRNLQGAINDTSRAAAAQRKRLLELQRTINNAPASRAQFEQMQRTRREIDQVTQALARQERQIKLWARTRDARSSGKQMMMDGSMKVMAAMGAGYALLQPISAFAKTESSETDLRTAMMRADGSVPEEFQKINDLAKALGNRLPGTTADFQLMMRELINQGITFQSILGGSGEAAAYMAVQLKMSFSEAATFTAKMLDATQSHESEILGLMDSIQKGMHLGLSSNEMLTAMASAAPSLGVIRKTGKAAIDEILPLIVMAGQNELIGSAAGNAFSKIVDRSIDLKRIKSAQKSLKGTGITFDFTNKKGGFGGTEHMIKEFDRLNTLLKQGKITDQRMRAFLKSLFGDDSETNQLINIIMTRGIEGYNEVITKMDSQANLQQRVNAQLTTLENLWDAAGGTFTSFMARLGSLLSPELKQAVQWLTKLNENLSNWSENNPELLRNIAKITGGAIALTAAIGGITMAAGLLKFAFVGHPIITALTLAVFLGMQLYDNFDEIMELWNSSPTFRWIASLTAIGSGLALIVGFAMKFKLFLASAAFAKSATLFMTMATGIKAMGLAMLTNPVFWFLAALGFAIYAVYKNWDTLVWFWQEGITQMQKDVGNLLAKIPGIGGALKLVWDVMSNGLGVIKDVSSWIVELITNTDSALMKLEELTRALAPELYKPKTNAEEITQFVNKQPQIADRELTRLYNNRVLSNPANTGIENFLSADEFVALAKAGKYDEANAKIKQYQQTMHQTNTIIVNGAGDPKAVGDTVLNGLKQSTDGSAKLWDTN